ncbi:Na(+) H(+) antiporter subunit F [hydrothermal vent metagenome]|uniref:Na(+) H(+) antiporter subunit F n=1 Tax=hydrothermal vent metagenome TaxID=652676 RepID=A0A3B0W2P6_9ZZZZ
MFYWAAIIIVLCAMLVLYRAIKGPVICDRVLAVNAIGTKAVLLIALSGYIYDRPQFLDIALTYALINFIATIAFQKYREMGRLD